MNSILGLAVPDTAESEAPTEVQESSFNFFDGQDDSIDEAPIEIEPLPEPIACYKNKAYRRYQMGNFDFKDHLLYIYSEAENQAFLEMHRSLPPIERNAIVAFNFKAVSNLEKPITSAAVRGITSSSNIKDPKVLK